MKERILAIMLLAAALHVLPAGESRAQADNESAPADSAAGDELADESFSDIAPGLASHQEGGCYGSCGSDRCCSGLFAGGEYLHIRTHFSEAVAFATVTDTLSAAGLVRSVRAAELDFDYESSFRVFVGYDLGNGSDIQFTYWYLDTETTVSGEPAVGQTIVDPFGNLGLAGSRIDTSAAVDLEVYDLDYVRRLNFCQNQLNLKLACGLRLADIHQHYDSLISVAGVTTSSGVFTANFEGVGPHFSLEGRTGLGTSGQLSLLGKFGMAILVGDYDVTSGVTIPGAAVGAQFAERTRAVPMLESELGVSWRLRQNLTVSAGWLFQAWFNVGTSGGTFDGENLPIAPVDTAFGGADDSDIMSFDGLFVRAEARF